MRIIIGISGASGVIYGIRLLELFHEQSDIETHLVITEMGPRDDFDRDRLFDQSGGGSRRSRSWYSGHGLADLERFVLLRWDDRCPCSVKTLSSVANCSNDNLLTRAADVTLKERRRLLLLFRETPLNEGHCRLMLDATRMGTIIMPPLPAFYTRPESISEMVDQTVGRVLDFWGWIWFR